MPFGEGNGDPKEHPSGREFLVFACNNYNIARLPRALQGPAPSRRAVRSAAPAATRYSDWRFLLPPRTGRYRDARRTLHLAVALAILRPDIVIPGDERSLYVMIALERRLGPITRKLLFGAAAALRRSLPPPDHIAAATRRDANHRLAEELKIPCPAAASPNSLAELESFAGEVGLPVVIKSEGSQAGSGVWICRTIEEVRRGWEERHRRTPGRRALVQKFIDGRPAMRAIAAVDGRVVAELSMIKEQCIRDRPAPARWSGSSRTPEWRKPATRWRGRWPDRIGEPRLHGRQRRKRLAHRVQSAADPRLASRAAGGAPRRGAGRRRPGSAPPLIADGTRIALYPQEWLRQGGEVRRNGTCCSIGRATIPCCWNA